MGELKHTCDSDEAKVSGLTTPVHLGQDVAEYPTVERNHSTEPPARRAVRARGARVEQVHIPMLARGAPCRGPRRLLRVGDDRRQADAKLPIGAEERGGGVRPVRCAWRVRALEKLHSKLVGPPPACLVSLVGVHTM